MPLYDFWNRKTGKVEEHKLPIAEKEAFLKKNKHLKSLLSIPAICDPVRMGIRRPDKNYVELLKRIKKANPGSTIKV